MKVEKKELFPAKQVPALLAIAWAGHKSEREPEAVGPDNFPVFPDDPLRAWHLLINGFLKETAEEHGWMVDASEQPSGKKLLTGDVAWRGQAILAAGARVAWAWKTPRWSGKLKSWIYDEHRLDAFRPLLAALFQTEFELTQEQTIELVRLVSGSCADEIALRVPPLGVVMAVEKAFAGKPLSVQVRKELMQLLRVLIRRAVPKERATESARVWRKLGANDAVAQMENPNAAFKRLADLLLDDLAF